MILRHGVNASYIIMEGWERHAERARVRDWCLDNGVPFDVHEGGFSGTAADGEPQIIVRFSRDDATLCYLTVKQ